MNDERTHFVDSESGGEPIEHRRQSLAIFRGATRYELLKHQGTDVSTTSLKPKERLTKKPSVTKPDDNSQQREPRSNNDADDKCDHDDAHNDHLG